MEMCYKLYHNFDRRENFLGQNLPQILVLNILQKNNFQSIGINKVTITFVLFIVMLESQTINLYKLMCLVIINWMKI